MTRRYYLPDLPANGGSITIQDAEFQHARVMRLGIGDSITLFDGRGNQANAVVTQMSRRECWCDAEPPAFIDREPQIELNLAIALPKPDRSRELIERLTELGVHRVTPLVAERTQRPPSNSLIDKLHRGVIEACKQSERNHLMQIADTQPAADFFSDPPHADHRWLLHPGGISVPDLASAGGDGDDQPNAPHTGSQRVVVVAAIGPEGGWTDEEAAAADAANFQRIDLGKRILRIETACAVIAAKLAD